MEEEKTVVKLCVFLLFYTQGGEKENLVVKLCVFLPKQSIVFLLVFLQFFIIRLAVVEEEVVEVVAVVVGVVEVVAAAHAADVWIICCSCPLPGMFLWYSSHGGKEENVIWFTEGSL